MPDIIRTDTMRFFTPTAAASEIKPAVRAGVRYINVGGELFHALAVTLIDYFKNSAEVSRDDDAAIKKILEPLYTLFPKYITNQPYLTANERIKMLIKNARISELVECMAYTLRQITVSELYANPLQLSYREVFMSLDKNSDKEVLRNPVTKIPVHSAMDACANALGISILVNGVEHGKELGKRMQYPVHPNGKLSRCKVKIQAQNDHYFPGVIKENDFSFVGQLALRQAQPSENHQERETVSDMIEWVEADNQTLLRTYMQWQQSLLAMVAGEDLTAADLVNLYITFLPEQTLALPDTHAFFSQLTKTTLKPVVPGESDSNQLITLTIDALSAWISLGIADPEKMFDQNETLVSAPTN